MDFQQIHQNVMKYLEKQKKSVLNPRGLNLTIKKLDLYVSSFHTELNELLQLENKHVNLEIEEKIKRPSIKLTDLNELEDSEKMKSTLISVSNKLISELNELIRNSRGLNRFDYSPKNRFRQNVYYILRKELDISYADTTLLHRIVYAIEKNIERGYYEEYDWFENAFQKIRSNEVIEELRGNIEEKLHVIIDDMFGKYKKYFLNCMEDYKKHYNAVPVTDIEENDVAATTYPAETSAPTNTEQIELAIEGTEGSKGLQEELPQESVQDIVYETLDSSIEEPREEIIRNESAEQIEDQDFITLNERAYFENGKQKMIQSITVSYDNGEKRMVAFDLIDNQLQHELEKLLKIN